MTLRSVEASISMTEDYKPTDNAVLERVNGIIKYRMKRPKNIRQARNIIGAIVNSITPNDRICAKIC
ncbi:MAG: hypothetical protein ACI4V5_03140 [Prevotella sp.]